MEHRFVTYFGLFLFAVLIVIPAPMFACPAGCTCHYETDTDLRVDCTGKEFSEIPDDIPLNTTKLYLQDTNITHIPRERLSNLTKLTILSIKDSMVASVDDNAFLNLNPLTQLSFEKNKLRNIPSGSFGPLSNLLELNMASNVIQSLPNNAFVGLSRLTKLILSSNVIDSLNTGSFSGLGQLNELKLDRNQIDSLSSQFTNLGMLQHLDLRNNQISTLSASSFGTISNLNNLDLSSNSITSIACSTFQNTQNILYLLLTGNRLTSVPPVCVLQHLSKIDTLDLSANQIVSVQDNAFNSITTLKNLRLNNMPSLLTVTKGAFQGLSQISALSINSNPNFTEFTKDHVKPNLHPRLSQLLLHENGLRHLDKDVLLPQSMLLKASVNGNPLHCNCSLKWIAEVIKNYLHHPWASDWIFFSGSPGCQSPPNMEGLLFKDLIEDDLTCQQPTIQPVSAVQQVAYRGWNSSIVVHTAPGLPSSVWTNPKGRAMSPDDIVQRGRVYVTQDVLADHVIQSGYYISNVTDDDKGRYTLRVRNAGGEITHDFNLDVTDPPPVMSVATPTVPYGITTTLLTIACLLNCECLKPV